MRLREHVRLGNTTIDTRWARRGMEGATGRWTKKRTQNTCTI